MKDSSGVDVSAVLATPLSSEGIFGSLLSGPAVPALVAQFGVRVAAWWVDPIRFGGTVIVARHANVVEVLKRDLDFFIAPVNGKRIVEVNGPFVLGMDRGATLALERGALYQSLMEVDFAPIRCRARAASARQGPASCGRRHSPRSAHECRTHPTSAGW
jgi:hypothetical protein